MLLPIKLSRSGLPVPASFGAAFQPELAAIASSVSNFLSPAEIAYLETLRFPLRRNSFLLGRCAAKKALSHCVGEPDPSRIEIVKGVFDQPVVISSGRKSAELSLSHSAGAAIALACHLGHPIGVDIEFVQDANAEFLSSCLTSHDAKLMAALPQPPPVARYLIWSMKEALSKALRCGLMTPFQVFELSSITLNSGACLAHFSNFAQYKAHAWLIGRFVLSIVLPRKTEIEFTPDLLADDLASAASTM